MRATDEQRAARTFLRGLVAKTGVRYRVVDDPEGWPLIPGRYGRIEFVDRTRIAVFSEASGQLRKKILALPDARRSQIGDTELRIVLPVARLADACAVIRARRRRSAESAARLRRVA